MAAGGRREPSGEQGSGAARRGFGLRENGAAQRLRRRGSGHNRRFEAILQALLASRPRAHRGLWRGLAGAALAGCLLLAQTPAWAQGASTASRVAATTAGHTLEQAADVMHASGTVRAYVTLDGQRAQAGQFTFVLRSVPDDETTSSSNWGWGNQGQPNWSTPGSVVATATNDASGTVTFKLNFDTGGYYCYLLEEVAGDDASIVYSTRKVQVQAQVLDLGTMLLTSFVSENGTTTIPTFANQTKEATAATSSQTGAASSASAGAAEKGAGDKNTASSQGSASVGATTRVHVSSTRRQSSPEVQEGGRWVHSSGGWWWRQADGSYPRSRWLKIDGAWYAFDAQGYLRTGWFDDGGTWYWLGFSGAMRTGWQKVAGVWYYLEPSGAMATGWAWVDGTWYLLASSGAMETGWQLVGGQWYYLEPSGAMAANRWVGDYYVGSSGAMARNAWIGRYHVGSNGAWDATR